MTYSTGYHPDRDSSRERDRVDFNFSHTTSPGKLEFPLSEDTFVQPVQWIRSQLGFPSCVGQTIAEIVDALGYEGNLPEPTWASAVSIWRDARRRQGLIEAIDLGTRLEYAIDSLVERGWDPFRQGEDSDEEEAGKGAAPAGDDLADEMFAYDERLAVDIKRYRILGLGSSVLDAVDEALRRGWGVGIGTGLKEPFFHYSSTPDKTDQVLGLDYMSGNENRHAQRVAGRATRDGRRIYLVQNHWSPQWGGVHLPDGGWLGGCCWVDESVIVVANDVHVVEIRT